MLGSDRGILLAEGELKRLELLVAIQVALEVLQQDHLLVDGLRVIEEVVLRDLLLVVGRANPSDAVDVVEMEEVRVSDDLG